MDIRGTAQPAGVEGAHRRREALRHAMVVLEDASSAPVGDRSQWCARLAEALVVAQDTIAEHVRETEAPEGMYDQLEEGHEWLHTKVQRLRDEHPVLMAHARELQHRCELRDDPETIRDDVMALVGQLARHRSHGADLLHEAYNVDVSVGD